MKCKHDQRYSLTEWGDSWTNHIVNGDKLSHDSDFGDYNSIVTFECFTCGYKGRFNLESKTVPAWVKERWQRCTD